MSDKLDLAEKTEHKISEEVSVAFEYHSIGKMVHEILGESRIIHEIGKDKNTGRKNDKPEEIKKTAEEFFKKAFAEYDKERNYRIQALLIRKASLIIIVVIVSILTYLLLKK